MIRPTSRSCRRGAGVAATACALWLSGGCGYSTDRPFPTTADDGQPIRTIAVEIFESREFRRGLELQLAEALMKRIEAETPYRLASRENADTLLTGEIKEIRQSTIGRDFRRNRPRETAMTLIIAFHWKNLRTGRTLVERPNFIQTVDYVRPLGEDFYDASQEAMDKIAERIVEQMESEW
ncbi:MAG: hypothetical protein HUU22_02860 [Phycisphaerae bacterium]|nr:LPS assembly lipoprotein LptE [Phycisphaerae bacterium]NUQ44955.1 hypothetical protein [Phycisphaerae bacterium]